VRDILKDYFKWRDVTGNPIFILLWLYIERVKKIFIKAEKSAYINGK